MKPHLRSEVARYSRRLHAAGWCANHDGNVSLRVGRDRFLCTPTAVSKAVVDEEMLVVVDGSGRVVEGRRKPFGEMEVHLAIYRARPDAQAVVHAHPPHATAFGVAGVSLEVAALPEILVSLGRGVPTVALHLPKTPELIRDVTRAARTSHAFLAAGNGAFAMGTDLEQAYLRLELVEHYAKIISLSRQLGGVRELSSEQISTLLQARAKAGLEPPEAAPPAESPSRPAAIPPPLFPPRPAGAPVTAEVEALAARVADRIRATGPAGLDVRACVEEELRAMLDGSRVA